VINLEDLKCCKCKNPLRIIKGGQKSDIGSTDIVMVHVFGCMNESCDMAMKEQHRVEDTVESFTE